MAMPIVDRRLNPGSKSLENRQRFLRRAKALVQGAVHGQESLAPETRTMCCRREAKMPALSKVGMSVFSLLVVRFGGCGSDGCGAAGQARAESD